MKRISEAEVFGISIVILGIFVGILLRNLIKLTF